MNLQNLFAAHDIRHADGNFTVKTAGAQQGRVQNIRPVGGGDNDDALVGGKTVHFHQQLVQGLFPFIMPAAQAGAALAADRVDFIDENDAGGMFFGLVEQIPHAGSADAHKHFDEVRTGNGEEGHAGLARNRAGQQGFTGTGRAIEQHALGDARAQGIELARVLEEIDDLLQLLLHLIHTGDIGKGNLLAVVGMKLGTAFAELHDLAAAALALVHHKDQKPGD